MQLSQVVYRFIGKRTIWDMFTISSVKNKGEGIFDVRRKWTPTELVSNKMQERDKDKLLLRVSTGIVSPSKTASLHHYLFALLCVEKKSQRKFRIDKAMNNSTKVTTNHC